MSDDLFIYLLKPYGPVNRTWPFTSSNLIQVTYNKHLDYLEHNTKTCTSKYVPCCCRGWRCRRAWGVSRCCRKQSQGCWRRKPQSRAGGQCVGQSQPAGGAHGKQPKQEVKATSNTNVLIAKTKNLSIPFTLRYSQKSKPKRQAGSNPQHVFIHASKQYAYDYEYHIFSVIIILCLGLAVHFLSLVHCTEYNFKISENSAFSYGRSRDFFFFNQHFLSIPNTKPRSSQTKFPWQSSCENTTARETTLHSHNTCHTKTFTENQFGL